MNSYFKKGDIVKCIDPLYWNDIKKGGYYKVVKHDAYSDDLEVINNVNDICGYSESLFVPAEIKVGDYIEGDFGYGRVAVIQLSAENLLCGVVMDKFGTILWVPFHKSNLVYHHSKEDFKVGDIVEILDNPSYAYKKGSKELYKKGDYTEVLDILGNSVNIDGAGSDGQYVSKSSIRLAFRPAHPKIMRPVEVENNPLEVFINGKRLGCFIANDHKELHIKPTLDFLEELDIDKLEKYVKTRKELKLYKGLVEDSYQQYQEDLQTVDKLERDLLHVFQ